MAVVLLDHPGVDVAEVARHDHHRHAVHDGQRGPRVPQRVEIDGRVDPGAQTGLPHRLGLVSSPPVRAVGLSQYDLAAGAAGRELPEESCALVGQHDMAHLAGFGPEDRDRAAIGVEIRDL